MLHVISLAQVALTAARARVKTVARMLKERQRKDPEPEENATSATSVGETRKGKPVHPKEPNYVWQIDLTSDGSRILGAVAAVFDSSDLAFQLVGGVRR